MPAAFVWGRFWGEFLWAMAFAHHNSVAGVGLVIGGFYAAAAGAVGYLVGLIALTRLNFRVLSRRLSASEYAWRVVAPICAAAALGAASVAPALLRYLRSTRPGVLFTTNRIAKAIDTQECAPKVSSVVACSYRSRENPELINIPSSPLSVACTKGHFEVSGWSAGPVTTTVGELEYQDGGVAVALSDSENRAGLALLVYLPGWQDALFVFDSTGKLIHREIIQVSVKDDSLWSCPSGVNGAAFVVSVGKRFRYSVRL